MSQVDYDITQADADTGVDFRAAVNAALQALVSNNSGLTPPSTTYPYMFWVDTSTTTPTLKQRNGDDNAWVSLFQLSASQWLFVNDILINGITIGKGGGTFSDNTAIGLDALKSNTTGRRNVASGDYSLTQNTTAWSNTAYGSGALTSNTTSYNNVAVGTNALSNSGLTGTSENNTAVGCEAGSSLIAGPGVFTVNNSVFIGFRATASADGNSNEIVIGSEVEGSGSNTATFGNTSITKTILRGEVVAPALTTGLTTQIGATYTVAGTITSIIANYAGIMTLTLPAAATYPGRIINLKTITANTVVSASSNVVPLAGGAAGTDILAATAGKWATLQSDGTAWQIMAAN